MAGIITDFKSDIQRLNEIKQAIVGVKNELKSINIKVNVDIKESLEAKLQSLMKQYDALVLKIGQAEGKIMISVKRINDASNKIIEAQEKLSKGTGATSQPTNQSYVPTVNTAETASIQVQSKAYDDLAVEIQNVFEKRELNISSLIKEMKAVELYKKSIAGVERGIKESNGSPSSSQVKLLEYYNKQLIAHKTALSEVRQVLNNNAKLDNAATTSMNGLSQSVSRMRIAYRELTEEERKSPFGKELLNSIRHADAQIKELDSTIGNHQRNVGNYKAQWNGLNMSIQQVGRELPSLAYGPKVFFSAISNNLPILADEIKRARIEYDLLKKSGQSATPVWKQITSSLFSWQTALTVGITLLTLYGDKVVDWVGGLFKAKEAIKELLSAEHEMALARQKAMQSIIKEGIGIDLLYKRLKDTSTSTKERNVAVSEWLEKYPQYAYVIKGEEVDIKKLDTAYKSLREQIIATAIAKAQTERIEKVASERYKAWIKERNAYVSYLKSNEALSKNNSDLQRAITENSKKQWESAKNELKGYDKTLEEMTNQVDVSKLFPQPEKGTFDYWQKQVQIADTALKQIKDKYLKVLKSDDKEKIKLVPEDVRTQYAEATKLKNQAEKALNIYGDSSKQESAAEKLRKNQEAIRAQQEKYDLLMDKQALDRKRTAEDLENQATQASIDAKADGFVKIQAQRELDNKKEIQALERQKEDYIRAMIQVEKDKFDAKEELNEKSIKGYKRKTFDSSTVTVDTSKWDKIIKDTETKQGLNEWEQREASMNEYLLKYGTFSQKKEVIDKKYRDAIEKETDLGTKNTLKKEWEEATSALDMDKLKQGINWELIFGDLSKVSKKSLEEVKGQLRTFKSSPEYNNMTVEQKKVVDESLNNIQTTIIDKGGLLGDLPEQLDALRIAQKELTEAQEEYDKAMKNGTEAQQEAALKKKNAAQQGVTNAETNVTKAKDKTVTNLIALSDSITQLGGSSEMSLSQIGNLAENITNVFAEAGSKIGGIIGAAFSLLDVIDKQGFDVFVENIFSSVFNAARGVLDTITFGAFSKITGSGDSDKNLEKDLEALAQSNEDLKNSLDNLSEKMDKASVTDASDIYEVQKENLKKLESNTLESMQRSAAAYNNGFMGIGGSHSSSNKIDNGISASEWSRISEIVGSSVQNAGQFFQLSSEQMAKLAEEDTTLYSKIKDLANDGYKDAAQYMDEYITYYKQLEELENAYNEKLTNTSFDSVRDEFKNALLDMESDVEDFAANFEKMMQNAIVESLMTKKYDKLIQEWYGKFAKAMEGDGTIDENEQRDLKKDWNDIVNQGIAERNALKDAMGWDNGSSYSEESSKRNFASMSQDTGNELNGRFTAFQISNEEIKNQSIQQTGLLSSINEKMSLLNLTNKDIPALTSGIPNIADQSRESIMNSYHPQINVIFPDAKIDVLTTEISSLRNTVVDMQRMQAEGLLDGKDIMSNTGVLAKNSPKILSNTDEMKRDIKNAL